jgi:ubiquinone/menaquinone biosynthesis C-methylase UbiE
MEAIKQPPYAAERAKVLRRFVSEFGEAQEEVTCPLCGDNDAELALEGSDILYGKPGRYRVVRCRNCSLSFVNPRPTFEALAAHYPDDYMCYLAPEADTTMFRGLFEAIAQSLTRRRLARLEKVIGRIAPGAKLADVGCGLNELLATIKRERGPVGVGIDVKASMVERIQQQLHMPAVHGTLADAHFADAELDLLLMLEYLEHEAAPCDVLAEARRVIKPGGHIAVEIPHMTGIPARLFKTRWFNLDVPRHLVFFEPSTLRRAFADQGFELLSYESFSTPLNIGISVLFSLGGVNLGRSALAPFAAALLGVPFLPIQRFMPEFAFAVGRAI